MCFYIHFQTSFGYPKESCDSTTHYFGKISCTLMIRFDWYIMYYFIGAAAICMAIFFWPHRSIHLHPRPQIKSQQGFFNLVSLLLLATIDILLCEFFFVKLYLSLLTICVAMFLLVVLALHASEASCKLCHYSKRMSRLLVKSRDN